MLKNRAEKSYEKSNSRLTVTYLAWNQDDAMQLLLNLEHGEPDRHLREIESATITTTVKRVETFTQARLDEGV